MGQENCERLLTCSFFLPTLFVPGLMLSTGDIDRDHGRSDGQEGLGKGPLKEESLQEEVRWRGLAGLALVP